MMRRSITLMLVGAFTISLSGCVFVQQQPTGQKKSAVKSQSCHPSQYWDGQQCVHKGKGKGARKHDG
jgi:hypothetical protein